MLVDIETSRLQVAVGLSRQAHIETRTGVELRRSDESSGGLAAWYGDAGGRVGLWWRCADDVHRQAIEGGHFFPEEVPAETSRPVREFLTARRS